MALPLGSLLSEPASLYRLEQTKAQFKSQNKEGKEEPPQPQSRHIKLQKAFLDHLQRQPCPLSFSHLSLLLPHCQVNVFRLPAGWENQEDICLCCSGAEHSVCSFGTGSDGCSIQSLPASCSLDIALGLGLNTLVVGEGGSGYYKVMGKCVLGEMWGPEERERETLFQPDPGGGGIPAKLRRE